MKIRPARNAWGFPQLTAYGFPLPIAKFKQSLAPYYLRKALAN